MAKRLKIFTSLIFSLLLSAGVSRATHIVGGDITYRHLGNNQYQIRLNIFFDCFNGNPDAISSDREANIGIFNASGQLVRNIAVIWEGPQRITNVNYSCVIPPANACVDYYWYTTTTTLQPITGGYTLAFQRCCRNGTITNLNDPGGQGATFYTQIPDVNISGYDNSPVFSRIPANFLCTNELFEFDHSASDLDGDSLVYELIRPYLGATRDAPRPVPPGRPPYIGVVYANGYNATRPMDGTPTMTIDPQTGKLSVIPTRAGQFVVGIAVFQYRNGKLIGRTHRDFQFNVSACVFNVKANFVQKDAYCSSFIEFENRSISGKTFRWEFGDPSTNADTSNLPNPTWRFPGPGFYEVTLRASDGNCENTIKKWIEVPSDTAKFLPDSAKFCFYDSVQIGQANANQLYSYQWTPATGLSSSTLAQPWAKPQNTTQYIVRRTYKSCFILDTIIVRPVKLSADFSYVYNPPCVGQKVDFTFTGDADYFRWDFGPAGSGGDTTRVFSRSYVYRDTGKYVATVTAFREGCERRSAKPIHVIDPSIFSTVKKFDICERDTIQLVPGGFGLTEPLVFSWSPTNDMLSPNVMNPLVFPRDDVNYVITKNFGDCIRYDTFKVRIMRLPGVRVGKLVTDSICSGAEAPLFVRGGNFYRWSPAQFLDDSTSADPIARPIVSTTFTVRVDSTNGCYTFDSVHVPVLPVYTLNLPEDTVLCEGEPLIFGNYITRSSFNWRQPGSDGFGTPNKEGKYILTVQNQCQTLTDTVNLFYFVEEHCTMQIPNAFTPNRDGKNDLFPFGRPAADVYIKPCSFPTYSLQIFTRWGQRIFESNDPEYQWDGNIRGTAAPCDVYIWIINYQIFDQCRGFFRSKNISGNVTVLR